MPAPPIRCGGHDGPIDDQAPDNRWLAQGVVRGPTYDERWQRLAAEGRNVHGEADFVEGLGPASVLDAGCGTGRVAVELARRGIDVVGVDLDPSMLAVARAKAPSLAWVAGDLAVVDLGRSFDVVAMAGNVMIFLTPGTEAAVVANLARHVRAGGALVAGFQIPPADRPSSGPDLAAPNPAAPDLAGPDLAGPDLAGYDLAAYDGHCRAVGLGLEERWATWQREPFRAGDYAVSVHRKAPPHPG